MPPMLFPILIIFVGLPFLVGLSARRFITALKATTIIGVLWAALAIALGELVSSMHAPRGSFVPGLVDVAWITGIIVVTMLVGLCGHAIRQAFSALQRRKP